MLFDYEMRDKTLKEAVLQHGLYPVRSYLIRTQERALDEGRKEEADALGAKIDEVRIVFTRLRRKHWLRAASVSVPLVAVVFVILGWFKTDVWAHWFYFVFAYIFWVAASTLAVGFLKQISAYGILALLLGSVGSFGVQLYFWLKDGIWISYRVSDALLYFGIRFNAPTIEGWVGVNLAINSILEWCMDTSLAFGLLWFSPIFFVVLVFGPNWSLPTENAGDE